MRKIQFAEFDRTQYESPLCENLDLMVEGVLCESGFGTDPLVEKQDWDFNM